MHIQSIIMCMIWCVNVLSLPKNHGCDLFLPLTYTMSFQFHLSKYLLFIHFFILDTVSKLWFCTRIPFPLSSEENENKNNISELEINVNITSMSIHAPFMSSIAWLMIYYSFYYQSMLFGEMFPMVVVHFMANVSPFYSVLHSSKIFTGNILRRKNKKLCLFLLWVSPIIQ